MQVATHELAKNSDISQLQDRVQMTSRDGTPPFVLAVVLGSANS